MKDFTPADEAGGAVQAIHIATAGTLRALGIRAADLPGDLLQRLVCDDLTAGDLIYLAVRTGLPVHTIFDGA